MATVDDKVVAMSFESSKFESGVNRALAALEKLKAALKFPDAGKGLDQIDSSAKKVDLSHIGKAIDSIKGKLGALSVAAVAVFANMVNKAVSAGGRLVKALTIDPITQGLHEYETQLTAVQTIMANTQAAGTKLKDVNKALQELNTYSDKTIYNFSEMAKNIGTFTAAGVDLKTSTAAIKGIANLAALSGSNSQQAATAMYQLSQAISAGQVKLQDWNSVVNAGMGGTVFQRALAQTAERMGTLNKGSVELTGKMKNVSIAGQSFRESLTAKPGEKSWLTSKVLTETLKQFTGDLTDAQLKAKGFSDEQIKAIQATAQTAMKAATEVKTLSGVLDTAKETAGSGWAQTWQIIFGDFGEAKALFTGVSNAINGFINASASARNKVLGDWKELGGRTVLIEAIKNVFTALGAVIKPIKQAFRDIFPATTGKQLYDLTTRFKQFTDTLKMGPETANNLKRTFRGLFALLDIGKQIIAGIFTVFGRLFGIVGEGSGSFLKFTGSIGDFLVSVDQALKKGDRLHNFFVLLGSILAAPIRLLKQLASAIGELFGGFDQKASGGVSDSLDAMGRSMTPLQKLIQAISEAWRRFINSFGNAGQVIQPVVDGIVKVFQGITPALNSAIQSMNFSAILEVIRTGLLGGLVLMFKKFFAGGSFADALGGFGGGILGNISGAFDALTGSLKAMQTNIKADTLRKIAIAIALLTASVVALSFIDDKKLNKALAAMAIGFGQLLASMAILTKISGTAGFVKVPVIAASMILLAGAITLLTLAVRSLSSLSWGELIKGLTGVSVLLVVISQAAGPLSRNSAGMISAGLGITAIAVAMKILASAIGDFGGLSWGEIGKGLAGVAVGLALIAAASKLMPPGMVAIGAGLVAVALGLKILGSAVAQFGDMDWKVIGKGMVGIAGGLLIIAAAMNLMPKNMVVTAAGLLLVAIALKGVVSSIESFGGMSVGGLAKGLISLALALTILTVALYAMEGTLAGAAALAIAAAGLALLAPALVALGKQSWGQIVKGLVSLTAALVILGAAGILLEPVIPAMLGLGAALVLVGAGLALAGAGIALIGVGLSAIAVAGPVAVGILVQALVQLAESIPRVITKLVIGLLQVVQALAASAPKFVAAMAQILILLLDAIIKAAPKIAQAFTALLDMALSVIKSNQGKIIQAGFDLIIAFLKGINNNIPRVVSMFITIILTIINTVVGQLGRIVNAGAQLLAKFLIGIANNIATVVRSAVNVVLSFASGIAQTLGKITAQGLSIVTHLVSAVASGAAKLVSSGIKMVSNIITGIFDKLGDLASAGAKAAARFISSVAHAALELVDKGAQAIINFMNGVASAIRRYEPQMIRAGTNIGAAIISGLVSGITSSGGRIVSALGGVVGNAINAAKKKLHIKSPSRVFYEIGTNIIDGLALGITENEDTTTTAVESMVSNIADLANTIPSYLDGIIDMEPVITPVLDLTAVQAGADQMTGIIATTPVVAATSFGQASAISTAPPPGTEEAAQVPGTSVTFQQNNYSPEALSEVEIYRQTKNQISQLRTALALP